jgi:hypothetical protein
MIYKVKIDRSTIKKNPYYPNLPHYRYNGPVETHTTKITQIENGWRKEEFIQYGESEPFLTNFFEIRNGSCPDDWINKKSSFQPTQKYYCISEPKYFYDYEDVEVSCKECGEKFSCRELGYDCVDDYYSTKVCPKCDCWDCCELEFERLGDVEHEIIVGNS